MPLYRAATGSTAVEPGQVGYVADRWHGPQRSSQNNFTVSADVMYAIAIYVPRAVTIKALGVGVTTGVAATNAKLGVYSNVDGRPGVKLYELAAAVATATSSASASGSFSSNPTLAAGWYWLASLFSGAPTVYGLRSSDPLPGYNMGAADALGATNNAGAGTGVSGVATYAGGLPSSFGTATMRTLETPTVAFQVA